jgi:antitoxin component of RelBE/YafQ-DinJ toxin-antitoxin module
MQTMISFKIDRSLKNEARKTAKALGVSLNAVVNQQIKEFVANRQVVFTDYLVPNKKTRRILAMAERDLKRGKNIVGPFDSVDEFIKSLKKPNKSK